jgi:hypothetical protein
MKSRDLDLVLSVWAAPQATAGFADRVMVSCVAPQVRQAPVARRSRSVFARPRAFGRARLPAVAVAALVAASVLVPFLLSRSSPPPALAAIPVVADLGPLQD